MYFNSTPVRPICIREEVWSITRKLPKNETVCVTAGSFSGCYGRERLQSATDRLCGGTATSTLVPTSSSQSSSPSSSSSAAAATTTTSWVVSSDNWPWYCSRRRRRLPASLFHFYVAYCTRSSADDDNRLDAFSGQSRSTNMVPFSVHCDFSLSMWSAPRTKKFTNSLRHFLAVCCRSDATGLYILRHYLTE